MVAVILLDWSNPYTWLRQLCDWISFLHLVTKHLEPEVKEAMFQVMSRWRVRGKAQYPEPLEELFNWATREHEDIISAELGQIGRAKMSVHIGPLRLSSKSGNSQGTAVFSQGSSHHHQVEVLVSQ